MESRPYADSKKGWLSPVHSVDTTNLKMICDCGHVLFVLQMTMIPSFSDLKMTQKDAYYHILKVLCHNHDVFALIMTHFPTRFLNDELLSNKGVGFPVEHLLLNRK